MATTPYPFVSGAVLTANQLNSTFNVPVNNQTASYVLLASDGGKRVVMNAAGATTITVNTSLFGAGDSVWIHNIGAGTCTITAGTATVNTAASLALAQWEGGQLYFTSAATAIFFRGAGAQYGVATGGSSSSVTVGGINYTLLSFTTDANLVVSRSGLFDVLLVGGGGGGAGSSAGTTGGGGGAGALVGLATTTTLYLAAGTYAVDVGAGGAGINSNGSSSASASYIGSIISAAGGGCGSTFEFTTRGDGASGGGSYRATGFQGLSIDETFGNDGGFGTGTFSGTGASGGGGGYSSAGGNGVTATGGAGGNGVDVSTWTGGATNNVAAGGGGGGFTTGGAAGTGGVAGKTTGTGNNATTAGSGGGGTNNDTGGNGAAGQVWVRFKV
jgi:hypothetical protein